VQFPKHILSRRANLSNCLLLCNNLLFIPCEIGNLLIFYSIFVFWSVANALVFLEFGYLRILMMKNDCWSRFQNCIWLTNSFCDLTNLKEQMSLCGNYQTNEAMFSLDVACIAA